MDVDDSYHQELSSAEKVYSFTFTHQNAPKKSIEKSRYNHAVRTADCILPDSEKVAAQVKDQLSEFDGDTWVGHIGSPKAVISHVDKFELDEAEKNRASVESDFQVMGDCGWFCQTVWITITTSGGQVISIVIECDPQAWVYFCEDMPIDGGGLDYPIGEEPSCDDPTQLCDSGPGGPVQVDECEWMINPPHGMCEEPCNLNQSHLETLFPNANTNSLSKISETVKDLGPSFGLSDEETVSHFLAQTGYESNGMTELIENMNYSAERLVAVWPNRFSFTDPNKENPNDYAGDPEKLANYVYSNRMGNGPPSSGDGWKFRGRGLMQLTFRDNYQGFNSFYNNNFDENVNFVQNPNLITTDLNFAVISAMWFFKVNVLDMTDELTIREVTRRVSGSFNTVPQRLHLFNNINSTIEC